MSHRDPYYRACPRCNVMPHEYCPIIKDIPMRPWRSRLMKCTRYRLNMARRRLTGEPDAT